MVFVAQKRCKLQGKSKMPIEIMGFQILRHSHSVAQIEKKLVRTKKKKKDRDVHAPFKSKIMTLLTENGRSQPRSEFAQLTNLHKCIICCHARKTKNLKSLRRRKLGALNNRQSSILNPQSSIPRERGIEGHGFSVYLW